MSKTAGRPKKQQKAPKNGIRDRQYSIVIHDIKTGLKNIVDKKLDALKPDWRLVSEEEYNHQDGHHIHVFLKYKEKKAFSTVLNWFKEISAEHGAGRVQVDAGRGSFSQCEKYLTNPDKEKNVDNEVLRNVRRRSPQEANAYLLAKYPADAKPCGICAASVYAPSIKVRRQDGSIIEYDTLIFCPACRKKISAHNSLRPPSGQ